MVRVREPNMGLLHGLIPDGPLDGLIRATNHALNKSPQEKTKETLINFDTGLTNKDDRVEQPHGSIVLYSSPARADLGVLATTGRAGDV
jgi:hypothetical protein